MKAAGIERIVNARLVNEGRVEAGDLLIRDGRIAAVGKTPDIDCPTLDAEGAWLMPGMIDDQVHFREPGLTHKGDIASESAAAVAGGITSYLEMPNVDPLTIHQAAIDDKLRRAKGRSEANFGFYLGATNDNLEAIKGIDPGSVCGVKVFMGASTGNMLVDNPKTLEGIFAGTPLVVATHCEDTPTVLANEAAARARYGDAIPMSEHPAIRSAEACYLSSSLAVGLARKYGTQLHVLHLTTARELDLFAPGEMRDKHITAEACVHHLFFDDSWYASKGTDIKCNPAIKTAADREGLLAALRTGKIDIIATDHAPHTRAEKARPYMDAPAGLPLVQHALISLFDHCRSGALTPALIAEKTAHAPADRFQISERGYLREGYFADLALVAEGETDGGAGLLAKCGWSPFAGIQFAHRIRATWVNGQRRWQDGRLLPGGPLGSALRFTR